MLLLLCGGLILVAARDAEAAIAYATMGDLYFQDFDSLPTDLPNNANIETVYPDGWRDDTTTVTGSHISVPGWYLRHPLSPANENGSNGNQRVRAGPGANTGGFWVFGSFAGDPEKALGSVGSTTVAPNGERMFMALRLVNETGTTLESFTVTFDGEQWRDGQSPNPETLLFDYSLTATDLDWYSTATFTEVPELNFTSPVFGGAETSGTAVNGNIEGRLFDITATVSGIAWEPGEELWLRWGDPQLVSAADDGLAIDNVRFLAIPEPSGLMCLSLGVVALVGKRRRGK